MKVVCIGEDESMIRRISKAFTIAYTYVFIATLFLISCSGGGGASDSDTLAPLSSIIIEGAGSELNPVFNPEIYRYSINTVADTSTVSITPEMVDSASISINDGQISIGNSANFTALQAGETITITAGHEDSVHVKNCEILFLPADFPDLKTSILKSGVSSDPLYVTLKGSTSTYIANLDSNGVPTFYIKDDVGIGAYDYKLHKETNEKSYGRRLGTVNEWGRPNGEIVILDSDFSDPKVLTTVGLSHTDLHDFPILPNNEMVFLSYDGRGRDLSELGLSASEVVVES